VESGSIFVRTADEYLLGFIDNVRGLALHAEGDDIGAKAAFEHALDVGKRTAQRRVEGLVATNRAWMLYEESQPQIAATEIRRAISVFNRISPNDAQLANKLRQAFEWAVDGDAASEAEALWEFVRSDYINPDLIRRVTVAERILSLDTRPASNARVGAESFLNIARAHLNDVIAELGDA
jgi:hypothetical protein